MSNLIETRRHERRLLPCGRITLIIGPMFSGKSSELMRIVRSRDAIDHTCFVFSYKQDTRYDDDDDDGDDDSAWRGAVRSHPSPVCNQQVMPSTKIEHAKEAIEHVQKYEGFVNVCAFDEGQFYDDIVEVVQHLRESGIDVIVSALSGDYKRRAFDSVSKLVPLADHIEFMKACCRRCRRSDVAAFTHRITGERETKVIGGADKYEAVCGSCYEMLNGAGDSRRDTAKQ